jgi:hypothetical protein
MPILVLGGSGGIGHNVVHQLLERGIEVRAIVRSTGKVSAEFSTNPKLKIIQGKLLELSVEQLAEHVQGCDTVIACLGHNLTFRGMFLSGLIVRDATSLLAKAIASTKPARPVKFIEVNTVGIDNPDHTGFPRGLFEKGFIGTLKLILPPFKDSQKSMDYFVSEIGTTNPYIEWCVVRPDSLTDEKKVSEYELHPSIMNSIFSPKISSRENVAHFMCELALNEQTWGEWKFKYPIILNKQSTA